MLSRRVHAIEFAESLATELRASKWVRLMRDNPEAEHKVLSPHISDHLQKFVASRAGRGETPSPLFDWEGNATREWAQAHSYELLGTGAHPDAAVLQPFTCALEFDRQAATRGASYLKERLMKSACHVLSGAYDAALFVYLLGRQGDTKENYLGDENPFTRQLLASLRLHGLVVEVLPAS